jgi:hypothetical protein
MSIKSTKGCGRDTSSRLEAGYGTFLRATRIGRSRSLTSDVVQDCGFFVSLICFSTNFWV